MRKTSMLFVLAAASVLSRAEIPLRVYGGADAAWQNGRRLASAGLLPAEPGAAAVSGNPGLLGFVTRAEVEVGAGLTWSSEQRTRTVYDQFETAIGEVVTADNLDLVPALGAAAGVVPLASRLALGAAIGTFRDYRYRYSKEYRDDFYAKIGEDRIEQDGMLYAADVAAGIRVVDWLSAGLRARYLTGARSLDFVTVRGTDTTVESESGSPSGFGVGGGLGIEPLAGLVLGLELAGPVSLSEWRTGDSLVASETGRLPLAVTAAVAYRVPGAIPSRLQVEAGYHNWHGVDTTVSSIVTAGLAVEHQLLDRVALRYGAAIEPMPFDPTVQLVRVGAGLGFEVGSLVIDIGGRLNHDVLGPSHFRTPLAHADEKVYETNGVFGVSVRREL